MYPHRLFAAIVEVRGFRNFGYDFGLPPEWHPSDWLDRDAATYEIDERGFL